MNIPSATDVVSIFVQLPLLGIFIWFVIQTRREQSAAADKTHGEWRDWLAKRDADFLASQERHDNQRAEERKEMLLVLSRVDRQLEYLTNVTLLVYASVSGNGSEEMKKQLKEMVQGQNRGRERKE